MREAADEVVSHIKWKIVVLHRVRRYYSVSDLVMLWKSDVLSYIEYRTPAIYHACCTILKPIDDAQDRYLRDLGLSDLDALVHFRLAPLSCRRDIAMLGVIHRSVLGLGPRHFHKFVRPPWRWTAAHRVSQRHRFHLEDPIDGRHLNTFRNSVFGLMRVHNLLDADVVEARFVSSFQAKLQALLLARACAGCDDWRQTFSPRVPVASHPLR